jgi:tetratricopeptide (TPR) repeat protein
MPDRNIFSIVLAATSVVAYSPIVPASLPDSLAEVSQESRHLTEAGKWDEAKAVLEEHLSQTKDAIGVARLKAELAHYAADRNTYFHRDEPSVLAAIEQARSAVETGRDKNALATLEMAEGRSSYWKALDETKDWGRPAGHFDRALQIYKELGDEVGLGEAMFYRGLVFQMQDQDQRAREIFERALQITNRTGDGRMQSFVVRHIAYLQQQAAEIDAARANFQKSLQLRRQNDMRVFVPFALIALAEFEAEQKNLATAIQLIEEALPLSESGNSPRALYSGELALAKLYASEGKTAEAKKLAEQSRSGAAAFGDPSGVKEAENFLKEVKSCG